MALTFEPIATTTLSSTVAEITFSSIPQTYTDLCLIFSAKLDGTFNIFCRVNGNGSVNYGAQRILFNGSSAAAAPRDSQNDGWWLGVGLNAYAMAMVVDIPSYTNTGTYKTAVSHFGGTETGQGRCGITTSVFQGNTTAISSLVLRSDAGLFYSGTYATLYGITGA